MVEQTLSEEQREKKRERERWYHHNIRKLTEEYKEKRRKYYLENKEKHQRTVRGCFLKKNFGITWDDYEHMYESQEGLCAICREPEKKIMLSVDHNHITGEVRGLLCGSCNRALGLFKDNTEILERAKEYLDG